MTLALTFGRIVVLGDLFDGPTLMSFNQLQQKYNLTHQKMFRFLQVRDFILRRTTLTTNIEISQIERALSLGLTRSVVSFLYGILRSTATLNTLASGHQADMGEGPWGGNS